MTETTLATPADLDYALRTAWSELESFLAQLTEPDLLARDASGWTITDHLTHLAAWEDSVAALFRDRPRHEGLGVGAEFYAVAPFDEINDVVMRAHQHLTLAEATAALRRSHDALLESILTLSGADLDRTVAGLFPAASRDDHRRAMDFIYANSAGHFSEHLDWMRAILA